MGKVDSLESCSLGSLMLAGGVVCKPHCSTSHQNSHIIFNDYSTSSLGNTGHGNRTLNSLLEKLNLQETSFVHKTPYSSNCTTMKTNNIRAVNPLKRKRHEW